MDLARSLDDGQIYQAATFAQLPSARLEAMRQNLICPECEGPAFFRKASRNGTGPCFGARPHTDTCSFKASDVERIAEGGILEEDAIVNTGERIVVDLNFGASKTEYHSDASEGSGRAGTSPRYIGTGLRPDGKTHRRLSTILKNLIHSPQFRDSRQIIEIPDRPEIPVCDFFNLLETADASKQGKILGWWGPLVNAKITADSSLWLNSGGRGSMSICVPAEFRADFFDRFKLATIDDLAGAYVLVIGHLQISQRGKLYCTTGNINHIMINN